MVVKSCHESSGYGSVDAEEEEEEEDDDSSLLAPLFQVIHCSPIFLW